MKTKTLEMIIEYGKLMYDAGEDMDAAGAIEHFQNAHAKLFDIVSEENKGVENKVGNNNGVVTLTDAAVDRILYCLNRIYHMESDDPDSAFTYKIMTLFKSLKQTP